MESRSALVFHTFILGWLAVISTPSGAIEGVNGIEFVPEALSLTQSTDVQVNSPGDDGEGKTVQSETSIRMNPSTGTICVAYNDGSVSGFSRSTDGGASFVDGGDFPGTSGQVADPTLGWRAVDGFFYYVALAGLGNGIWRSIDDCETFSVLSDGVPGGDRPMMAIDNNPASLYFGRIYVATAGINVVFSENGTDWSNPVLASPATTGVVHAPWPAVDPTNGDVYLAYTNFLTDELMRIWVVRSTDGGLTWSPVAFPLDGGIRPREITATSRCGRHALLGDIFHMTAPQIALDGSGHLHIVYSRDPDGVDVGDVADVYYRRSTDQGIIWGPEVRLNDDATFTDQWNPALSVGASGVVAVSWYDRRNDGIGNVKYDRFVTLSQDNGVTWEANTRVSDVSSNVAPTIDLSKPCYHGEYDQQVQDESHVYVVWSDDRNIQYDEFNPDVWFEKVPVPWVFDDGFEDGTTGSWSNTTP
jgi:predicted RNA-binding protein with TRAM domain